MEVGSLGYLLASLFFTVVACKGLMRIIKDIKRIKPDSGDGNVKGVVVNIDVFMTGDVAPIVTYTSGSGEEKIYKYYFWYNRKKYPIGKEVFLKLSSASGLAYDKKDLIKGFLNMLFCTLLPVMMVLASVYDMIFLN